jgi:hypothetical protein
LNGLTKQPKIPLALSPFVPIHTNQLAVRRKPCFGEVGAAYYQESSFSGSKYEQFGMEGSRDLDRMKQVANVSQARPFGGRKRQKAVVGETIQNYSDVVVLGKSPKTIETVAFKKGRIKGKSTDYGVTERAPR